MPELAALFLRLQNMYEERQNLNWAELDMLPQKAVADDLYAGWTLNVEAMFSDMFGKMNTLHFFFS